THDTVADFSVVADAGGLLTVEIGAGDFDALTVTGNAVLNDPAGLVSTALRISLVGGFVPTVGQTFDFLVLSGGSASLAGKFDGGQGLFGFGDGSLYFDVADTGSGLQLVVKQVPGGVHLTPPSATANDALGEVLGDYFTLSSATINGGSVSIPGFVDING